MATQAQLIRKFTARNISLDDLLSQIGSATNPPRLEPPVRSFADTENDPDPNSGETGVAQLYVARVQGQITEAEHDAIYAAIYAAAQGT